MMSQSFQGGLLSSFERQAQQNSPDLYIGVGGTLNLSYIASLKPKAAVLIDINPVQRVFWKQVINDIGAHKKPSGFRRAAAITEDNVRAVLENQPVQKAGWFQRRRIQKKKESLLGMSSIFNLQHSFPDWLETDVPDRRWISDEYYSQLHDMVKEGRIGALTLDIADNDGVRQLMDTLGKRSLRADFFHISNVLSFMLGDSDWVGRNSAKGRLIENTVKNIRELSLPETSKVIGDVGFLDLDNLDFLKS